MIFLERMLLQTNMKAKKILEWKLITLLCRLHHHLPARGRWYESKLWIHNMRVNPGCTKLSHCFHSLSVFRALRCSVLLQDISVWCCAFFFSSSFILTGAISSSRRSSSIAAPGVYPTLHRKMENKSTISTSIFHFWKFIYSVIFLSPTSSVSFYIKLCTTSIFKILVYRGQQFVSNCSKVLGSL